jgi:hypothetical protein
MQRIVMGAIGLAAVVLAAPVDAREAAPTPAIRAADVTNVGSGPNGVGLVIDTGTEVKKVCVRFPEGSLTGAEVLARAQVQAVVAAQGPGIAVCSLCGVGCQGDGGCLTCDAPNYWSYWSAAAGATGFTYSSLGASQARVRSGAVEGWSWAGSDGDPPPFVAFDQICVDVIVGTPASTTSTTVAPTSPAPTTTEIPATTPAPATAEPVETTGDPDGSVETLETTASAATTTVASGTTSVASTTSAPEAATTTSTTVVASTTASTSGSTTSTTAAAAEVAIAPVESGGGGLGGVVATGGLLAALGGGTALVVRARRRA